MGGRRFVINHWYAKIAAACRQRGPGYDIRMKVTISAAILAVLSASCIDSSDLELAEEQQAETIEIRGCHPGYMELGEGDNTTCVAEPSLGWGWGSGAFGDSVNPMEADGAGGGGYGSGGPGPKPDRKQCGPEMGEQGCLDCCYYNYDHVDGWDCRKKTTPERERQCWAKAAEELGRCQKDVCNRHGGPPILTVRQ